MAVVAIAGDDLVTLLQRREDADDHRFLAYVEVAEPADEAHAVELSGTLLEAADQHHVGERPAKLVRRHRARPRVPAAPLRP